MPMYGMLLSHWVGAPSCYMELLDKLQKRICRTVGPSLAASLEPLAHCRNVTSLSLFYKCYLVCFNLFVLLSFATLCFVVAVEPCME